MTYDGGLAIKEKGHLRKDLRAPGRPSWQTEGLPLSSRPPAWPPGWWREGDSGLAKLRDPSDGSRVRRRGSECGIRTSAEPRTKVRRRTGPGACREGGAGIGPLPPRLPRCWGTALPPRAGRGGGDPEDDGPPWNLGLKTTTTEQKSTSKEALSHED
ncbi:hypothetical protein NDU88_004469 [Pleurodeles waltl]|uniref:Uncharacterized protein n=1 Tax=Pleurodeles waltl TaxID=8319 RepID=A0AAV7T892_PLEWA|nr:hypothetical protein NDU88_004469 [Pleurodeles waltl]